MGFSKVWVTGGQIAELRTPLRRPCVSCAPFAFEAATANSRTQTFFVQLDGVFFLKYSVASNSGLNSWFGDIVSFELFVGPHEENQLARVC